MNQNPSYSTIDQCGRQVNMPRLPRRIVSVVPSQTELLYDLATEGEIVGITWFCVHPADRVKNATKVGGTKNLKIDEIRSLSPDLIIANKEENTREQIEELAKEFPVYVSDVYDLASALEMIRAIGKITGSSKNAETLAGQIEQAFTRLSVQKPANNRVLYLIWRKPWMATGGDTFISVMLKAAGFENAIGHQKRYPELSDQEIRELNPDQVFLSSEPYPFKEKHLAECRELVPQAQVRLVDGEMFSWYGSRLLKAAPYLEWLNG